MASWVRERLLPNLRYDIPASLVVFLIAVPLSLGIAVASGAPVMAGLISAVIGGLVVGALGGSVAQVSGPAAGLTVIVFNLTHELGWPVTCAATAAAGVLQIILGAMRVGRGSLVIAPSVVHGMLAGIGVTITLAQIHVVLGGTPESSPIKNLGQLPGQIADLHGPATVLGLITLGILFSWRHMPVGIRAIPGPLVAVVTSTAISVWMNMDVPRVDLPASGFADHVWQQLPGIDKAAPFAVAVVSVAIIASVESLLSAVAVDRLHTGERTNLDRELTGQGAGNLISGLLGGLPVTGVIVRSKTNVAAGARTRTSAILHGVWVLSFSLLLGGLIEMIPMAVLAGLLVHVGISLVSPDHIRELKKHREAVVYFGTLIGVISLNLLEGVAVGIAISVLMTVRRLATTKIQVEEKGGRWHVRIEGTLTFASVPQLSGALASIPAGVNVDVDLAVDFLDHAAFEALHGWREVHERLGGHVDIDERHEAWYSYAEAGQPKEKRTTALSALSSLLTGRRPVTPSRADGTTLVEGIQEFERSGRSAVQAVLSGLARDGQRPRELFITCCDSRVVPTLFTGSGPGDLFKLRNIGNIVPTHHADGSKLSVGAALEYAISALDVRQIVICGHSSCGAMQALLDQPDFSQLPHLQSWLAHAQRSRERYLGETLWDGEMSAVDRLGRINVVQQMENLRTYPVVRDAEAAGSVSVVGLFFDIEAARTYLYDEKDRCFRPVLVGYHPAVPEEAETP